MASIITSLPWILFLLTACFGAIQSIRIKLIKSKNRAEKIKIMNEIVEESSRLKERSKEYERKIVSAKTLKGARSIHNDMVDDFMRNLDTYNTGKEPGHKKSR